MNIRKAFLKKYPGFTKMLLLVSAITTLTANGISFISVAQEDIENPVPIKMRKVVSVDDIIAMNIYTQPTPNSLEGTEEQEFPTLLRPVAIRCTPPPTQRNLDDR